MKKTRDIIAQIEEMQEDIIKRMFGDKEKNQLTAEEVKRVNELTRELAKQYMINEKPPANPELVLQYYQKAAPFMVIIPKGEKEARRKVRNRAVESYAAGQANLAEIQVGADTKLLERADQRFYRMATDEEKSQYYDYLKRSKMSYYEDSNFSQEEIKKAIAENEKSLIHLKFNILFRLLETKEEFFAHDMSDEELIEKYPDIINSVYVILEAEGIVDSVKKMNFSYDELPPSKIQRCYKLFNNIQDNVTKIDKRIATLADPYYTEMTIEDLWEVGPTKLQELMDGDDENDLLEEEGLQLMPIDSSEIVNEYDWQKLFDDNLNNNDEMRENKRIFDVKENFLGLVTDVQFVKNLENQALAGSIYGINYAESKRMMYYCDKDGKECDGAKHVDELLNQHGEIYLVSRFGDMDPVPIIQDKTKRGFSVLVGAEQISKAKDMDVPQQPQKPGRLTYFRNWIRFWDDQPLQEIQEYDAAKAKYDNAIAYNEKKRQLANKTIPDVIKQKVESVKQKNKEIVSQRKERREQMLKDFEEISKIPDSTYDTDAFDSKLADLLIGKAFVDSEKSMFRTLIFEKFNPYGKDFDEKKMADALKQSDGFREFVWELKNKYPKIIENLKSGEEFVQRPKDALEEAATYFCSRYKEENRAGKLDIFKMQGKDYVTFKEECKQFEKFERHINELAEHKEYKIVAKAAKKVLKEGSLENKKLLATFNDGQLYNCNGYVENDHELDLSKILSDILAQRKAEAEAAKQAKIDEIENKKNSFFKLQEDEGKVLLERTEVFKQFYGDKTIAEIMHSPGFHGYSFDRDFGINLARLYMLGEGFSVEDAFLDQRNNNASSPKEMEQNNKILEAKRKAGELVLELLEKSDESVNQKISDLLVSQMPKIVKKWEEVAENKFPNPLVKRTEKQFLSERISNLLYDMYQNTVGNHTRDEFFTKAFDQYNKEHSKKESLTSDKLVAIGHSAGNDMYHASYLSDMSEYFKVSSEMNEEKNEALSRFFASCAYNKYRDYIRKKNMISGSGVADSFTQKDYDKIPIPGMIRADFVGHIQNTILSSYSQVELEDAILTGKFYDSIDMELGDDGSVKELSCLDVKYRALDANKYPNTRTADQFTDMIRELNGAKTKDSSPQYKEITDFLKVVNKPDQETNTVPLKPEQWYVVKLLMLRKLIRDYIDYKAENGVGQKEYKELAAVEKLNQSVSERLYYLDTEPFKYGLCNKKIVALPSTDPNVRTVEIDLKKLPLTYNSEVKVSIERINKKGYKIPEPVNEKDLKTQYAKVSKNHSNVNVEEMKNAHTCMSRIILSAMRHGKTLEEVKVFEKQQREFWEHPVKEIPKEIERTAQVANNVGPGVNF